MNIYIAGQKTFGAHALAAIHQAGHHITGVSAPMWDDTRGQPDRLRAAAQDLDLPFLPSGILTADRLPEGTQLIIAAHSHDYIGRATRLRSEHGAIGYHPSLLPRHRGRDAIRWTVHMRDPIAGGTVYWLSDNVDAGDIAAQDWCWVLPDDNPGSLWRRELFPMGIRLLLTVIACVERGIRIAIPQGEESATWEPSWERPPIRRSDLLLLGDGTGSKNVLQTIREMQNHVQK